jgi:hypothetical protein
VQLGVMPGATRCAMMKLYYDERWQGMTAAAPLATGAWRAEAGARGVGVMLQPKTYPELLGKALMLDAEPILTMMEDDNPWVEGLFMVTCVGALLGGAHLVGGLLTTASLPPLEAVRETALASLQGALATTGSGATQVDALLRGLWGWAARIGGLAGGLDRLYFALWEPVWLMLQWLILGSVIHAAARGLGGRGTWVQTLGVTALTTAPHLLGLLTVIPFVAVSGLLTTVWSLLIAYRAVELTHDLSWQRAALAVAAAPLLLLLALGFGGVTLLAVWALWGGGV